MSDEERRVARKSEISRMMAMQFVIPEAYIAFRESIPGEKPFDILREYYESIGKPLTNFQLNFLKHTCKIETHYEPGRSDYVFKFYSNLATHVHLPPSRDQNDHE